MLPAQTLNAMWQSGFCADLIEKVKHTKRNDAHARVKILEEHVTECPECTRANVLKHLESKVARYMGPVSTAMFEAGVSFNSGNMLSVNGTPQATKYAQGLALVMEEALKDGIIDTDFIRWMEQVVQERAGKSRNWR